MSAASDRSAGYRVHPAPGVCAMAARAPGGAAACRPQGYSDSPRASTASSQARNERTVADLAYKGIGAALITALIGTAIKLVFGTGG
jgi:hypothetical protein